MKHDNNDEEENLALAEQACKRALELLSRGDPCNAALELNEALEALLPVLMDYKAAGWISAVDALDKLNATVTEGT